MPISRAGLKARKITVDVYKEIKRPGFAPGELIVTAHLVSDQTLDDELAMAEALEERDREAAKAAYAKLIMDNVIAWDYLDEDDSPPIPLTQEALTTVAQTEIMRHVLESIQETRNPGEAARRRSPRR